jgi:hypothetical protein
MSPFFFGVSVAPTKSASRKRCINIAPDPVCMRRTIMHPGANRWFHPDADIIFPARECRDFLSAKSAIQSGSITIFIKSSRRRIFVRRFCIEG